MFYKTKTQLYDLHWIDYCVSKREYFLDPAVDYQSLEVDAEQPFADWSELRTTIDDLCSEGFDRPVKHVIVDDATCVFLGSEKNWTQANYEEWISEGKCVLDAIDLREHISLPDHLDAEDVIFVLFFEKNIDDGDDEEDSIFQWGVFVPSE